MGKLEGRLGNIIHQEREDRRIRRLSGDKPTFMSVELGMSMGCPGGEIGFWSHHIYVGFLEK